MIKSERRKHKQDELLERSAPTTKYYLAFLPLRWTRGCRYLCRIRWKSSLTNTVKILMIDEARNNRNDRDLKCLSSLFLSPQWRGLLRNKSMKLPAVNATSECTYSWHLNGLKRVYTRTAWVVKILQAHTVVIWNTILICSCIAVINPLSYSHK